ncbi:M23 family metallopeptidase [Microbacterium sp. SSW1-59]|uniref:M23 family metallopeptidase n=1 Tax=Microbacterium xanthum TaxID=3079794 RepID=UPI002AD1D5DC|nr:M23 family metallopeptidase [Microbacterium sp. SSW1-59]MDZ8200114.1 M23 family metallopeptidase [Microbacterium sp. SSW1-59]
MIPASPQPAAPLSRRAARAARSVTGAIPVDEAAPVTTPLATTRAAQPHVTVTEVAGVDQAAPGVPAPGVPAEGVHADDLDADAFESAARRLNFTRETPVQPHAASTPDDPAQATADIGVAVAGHRARRRFEGAAFKRLAAASFSVGVMGAVTLLAVGTTTPAEALAAATGESVASVVVAPGTTDLTAAEEEQIQAYVAPEGVQNLQIQRSESYGTETYAELAAESGIANTSDLFYNDPNADIQWPFAVGVPMSSGFGYRWGALHEGVDFVPGDGSPIQAVADGVVREATESGGAYGVHVIVDHVIDGELVSTHYAHMQYGSIQVQVGQEIEVGTTLGLVGNTGRSYGAHLHFEVLMGGETAIDPIPWLREHAGG